MMKNDPLLLQSRILYQSELCIVINKLKGEACEGAKGKIIALPSALAKILPEKPELIEAVHRLDVPVTGCALFALTSSALEYLNTAFASRQAQGVEKRYWAIVEKPVASLPPNGEIVHWIETKSGINKSFAYNEEGHGRKKASLKYRITGEGKNYLFVEIQLLSGRHHQIRAQLAAIGLKIKGDLKYGAKRSEKDGGIRLHAQSLAFPNPFKNNEKISVTAQPPQMDALWEAFIQCPSSTL